MKILSLSIELQTTTQITLLTITANGLDGKIKVGLISNKARLSDNDIYANMHNYTFEHMRSEYLRDIHGINYTVYTVSLNKAPGRLVQYVMEVRIRHITVYNRAIQ